MKKNRLCICSNFTYPSTGGSEVVCSAVAEAMASKYGFEVTVLGFNVDDDVVHNGVTYRKCLKGGNFISQLAQNDHILIYSDSFWEFDTLLHNIDKIDCRVYLALVGAYHMQAHPETYILLKKHIDKFTLISHSKLNTDYKWCRNNNLPVKVIPNGVFLSVFSENTINFREKYKIKEKYIILSVSNYFFGKGQEILPQICRKLSRTLDDFVIVQCSNTVKYPYDKMFLDRTKGKSQGLNIRFMRDLPREDIVSAFLGSDVFLFPSKKEIFPLVILESRAAKLPYVALKVGNIMEQVGGVSVGFDAVDPKGYALADNNVISHLSSAVGSLLEGESLRRSVANEGQKDIDSIDWGEIVPMYYEEFSK